MDNKNKSYFIKLILASIAFVAFLAVLGLIAQVVKNKWAINPPPASQSIKNIEISSDKKAILNAETKEVIFTIADANKYLHEAGYGYNPDIFLNKTNQTTNAKYGGDCFSDASFKVSGYDRIVFSTACLSGDIQQPWVGIYNFPYKSKTDLAQVPRIYFLAGDNGKNFVWLEEGFYISYDVYSEADVPMKTKKIDIYGKIIYEKILDNKYFGNEYIQVKYPQKNTAIKSPVSISGKANVFEGNVRVRIKDKNENVLSDTFMNASGAYDKLYPFEKEISYTSPTSQTGVVEIFAEDMKNGGEINKIVIPVIFEDYADVSGWKNYRNEKYGFELKYPQDFEGQEPETGDILLEATKKDSGGSYYFTIKTRANYKIDRDASIVANSEKIIVGGHQGYKYFYTEGAGKSGVVLIQAGQDELTVSFDFIGDGQIANDRKIYFQDFFDQILSTFKFIN